MLDQLLERIARHARGYPGRVQLVFLGDYVDRGSDSRQVIDRLIRLPGEVDAECVFLRGNHEQVFMDFFKDPSLGRPWFTFGGLNTLISYEVPVRKIPTTQEDYETLRIAFGKRVPREHRRFIKKTRIHHSLGNCFFVHAGIRPGVPLREQQRSDLLWIKEDFVQSRRRHERLIVHGHFIESDPVILPNRIGLDTGAFMTGRLTCAVFEGNEIELLVARDAAALEEAS